MWHLRGEPRLPKLLAKPEILEEFRNLNRRLRPGPKMAIFCKKKKSSMKKENVSYSVMNFKKGLRMIRLCNLLYEKTVQFASQQTQVWLHPGTAYMRIRWRSYKVCCTKKHSIQCETLKYLRRTKGSAIKQAPLKGQNDNHNGMKVGHVK